jgi:hypothetical protein
MYQPSYKSSIIRAKGAVTLILVLPFIMLTMGCALFERLKGDIIVEGSYDPILIPITISINSLGEVNLKPRSDLSVPTPIGVFHAGAYLETNPFVQATHNVLIIKIDDQECAYDLHGDKFEVNLEGGNYQLVSLSTENDNIYIELKGDHYTGCSQDWSTVAVSNPVQGSGNEADCPGASPSYLDVGEAAYISVFQASVLKEPSEFASFAKYKYLDGGNVVTIIDGPVCGPGNPGHVLFWKVQSEVIHFADGTSGVVEGWVAEESGDIYLLRPVEQSSLKPSL